MSLSHRCGGNLAQSSLQNCFNSATLAWMACLRSFHSISVEFKSGLWLSHSITFILFSLSHAEVDLLLCFRSLSCCRTRVHFSLRSWNDYDTLSRSWSSQAASDHHTITTVCLTPSQKFQVCLICLQNIVPKDVFSKCVLFGQRWFGTEHWPPLRPLRSAIL